MLANLDRAFAPYVANHARSRSSAAARDDARRISSATARATGAQWSPAGTSIALAQSDDLVAEARRLRYRIFVEEQGRRFPNADLARREIPDALDARANIWCAFEGTTLVGTMMQTLIGPDFDLGKLPPGLDLSGFPRSATYSFAYSGRFAIEATHRSTWVLPSLARHSYVHGRERGGKFDFMAMSPAYVPMFERLGYLRYTAFGIHLSSEGGVVIPMVLPATDHAHLERVRSAFRSAASRFAAEPEWAAWLRASHPIIDVYYGSARRPIDEAAALSEWLGIPLDVAAELNALSFVHVFPAGAALRRPGDRVTYTLVAVNAPLEVTGACEVSGAARLANDGVSLAGAEIRCASETVVLCVPDAAVERTVRRYPAWGERLGRLFLEESEAEREVLRIYR